MSAEEKLGVVSRKISEAIGRATAFSDPELRDTLIEAGELLDDVMDELSGPTL